jgi:hypothetical protein
MFYCLYRLISGVTLYFSHPICLILYKSLRGNFPQKAIFVNPDPFDRGKYMSDHLREVTETRYKSSTELSKILEIELSRIEWQDFIKLNEIIIDSTIIHSRLARNNTIIFQGGDVYTILGFKNHFNFLKTKLNLLYYWRSRIDISKQKIIYFFNENKLKVPFRNCKFFDFESTIELLVESSKLVLPNLLSESELKLELNEKYALILPPNPHYYGMEFTKKFMELVFKYTSKNNLKIIIKPHRNDSTDYSKEFSNSTITPCRYEILKYYEAEFLFSIENIVHIISSPSSALSFADKSKLTVIAPRQKELYRRFNVDQETFLRFLGIDFKLI